MSKRASLRATRPSGAVSQQVDRGAPLSDRQAITYWCTVPHRTTAVLAAGAEPPESWDCHVCGAVATRDPEGPPAAVRAPVFYRTPFEFLMMRRTTEEGERLLSDAMDELHARRRKGEVR